MQKLTKKYNEMPVQMKAALWFLVCGFMQKGISTITTPIFTRLLTTEEYGQYSVFLSWESVLGVFVTMNLSYGVYTQGLVKFEEDKDKFSSALQGLTTTLVLFSLMIYITGREFWNQLLTLTTPMVICMLVCLWATASFGFWAARQRVDYQYRVLVLVTIFVAFMKPASGIVSILLFPAYRVEARIISLTCVEVLAYTGLYVMQMCKGRRYFSRFYWKYALNFNVPLIPHYLSMTVLSSSDRIMISRMCTAADAGIYSLAYSISLIMTIANTAAMNTLSPWIYKSIKSGDCKKIGEKSSIILVAIGAVNLLLIAFAPEAIYIFAPSTYHDAIWVVPPVAMSVFFMFMYDMYAKFSFYYEKTKLIMVASCLAAGLNVVLNAIFINLFGYIAAAYTTLFCYIAFTCGHYVMMRWVQVKYMKGVKVYQLKIILAISLGFMTCGFAMMALYEYSILRYVVILLGIVAIVVKRKSIIELKSFFQG